jgi:hypothetical protein
VNDLRESVALFLLNSTSQTLLSRSAILTRTFRKCSQSLVLARDGKFQGIARTPPLFYSSQSSSCVSLERALSLTPPFQHGGCFQCARSDYFLLPRLLNAGIIRKCWKTNRLCAVCASMPYVLVKCASHMRAIHLCWLSPFDMVSNIIWMRSAYLQWNTRQLR